MSIFPDVGTPDYLSPSPGSTRILLDEHYTPGAASGTVGVFDTSAYRALAFTVTNNTAALLNVGIFYHTQLGPPFFGPAGRTAVIPAGGTLLLNVPCTAPTLRIVATSADNVTPVDAQIRVDGHGSETAQWAERGVTVLTDLNGTSVAAGATTTITPLTIVEGDALLTFSLFSASTLFTFDLTAVDGGGATRRLFQTSGNATTPLVTVTERLYLPPWPLTVKFKNLDTAARNAYLSLVAGG